MRAAMEIYLNGLCLMTIHMKRTANQMVAATHHLLFLLLLLSNGIFAAKAAVYHWINCDGTANFTTNSTFEQNLSKTLLFLTNSTSQTGFNITTIGGETNGVTALAICRGDLGQSNCQDCIEAAASGIRERCPNQTKAQIWFDDCWLRYSNSSSFSPYDGKTQYYYPSSTSAPDPQTFNNRLGNFMDILYGEAAAADSKFMAGKTRLSDFNWIYGLVQCEKNLTESQCKDCFNRALAEIPLWVAGNWSGLVGSTSCSIRFSLDSFYNESAVSPLPSPTPPPPVQVLDPPPGLPTKSRNSGGGGRKSAAIGVAVAVMVVACFVGLCLCLVVKKKKRKQTGGKRKREGMVEKAAMEDRIEMDSVFFDFQSLAAATGGFSDANRLGRGGFGPVYKGTMSDGKEIAVKKLSTKSTQGIVEFMNEVRLLLKIQHRNLVLLLGCCHERGQKMLVYEYLPNKSLDKFLFDKVQSALLDWTKRFNIILGIARGLLYLHEDSQLKIIHRDIKASNILLDNHLSPKISDFGLARLFQEEKTHVNTRKIAGTYGYMAPEYAAWGILSTKCDVFSFGVLVLEIMSGVKNYDEQLAEERRQLLSHAWRLAKEGKLLELVDVNIGSFPHQEAMKCIEIGLLCCQANAKDRPTMSSVVLMLSNNSISIPRPGTPGYQFSERKDGQSSGMNPSLGTSGDSSTSSQNNHFSKNSITMSLLDGR